MDDSNVAEGVWLPIAEAARRLGITPQAVRGRIGRGTLEVREEVRGNRRRTLVKLPDTVPGAVPDIVLAPAPQHVEQRDDSVVILREQVARLEERLAAADETKAELRRELAETKAERDRLLALLERYRWPGLWPWLRRFWSGEE